MDTSEKPSRPTYFYPIWTIGNVLSIVVSLGSIVVMIVGGFMVLARMQTSSEQIPSLLLITKEQSMDIAVLQDQQKNLDGKYAEIMLQLSRLDAKLDKQNDYLFESLQHINSKQKNSY